MWALLDCSYPQTMPHHLSRISVKPRFVSYPQTSPHHLSRISVKPRFVSYLQTSPHLPSRISGLWPPISNADSNLLIQYVRLTAGRTAPSTRQTDLRTRGGESATNLGALILVAGIIVGLFTLSEVSEGLITTMALIGFMVRIFAASKSAKVAS